MHDFGRIHSQKSKLSQHPHNSHPHIYSSINQQERNFNNIGICTAPFYYSRYNQPAQGVFTSSSSASSIAELAAINGRDSVGVPTIFNINCRQYFQKLVPNTRNVRKQHTLDSIGSETSRSRSPIVASSTMATLNGSNSNLSTGANMDRRCVSTNPFEAPICEMQNLGSVGSTNFTHRRTASRAEDVAMLATTTPAAVQQPSESRMTSEDNLSLDQILSDIQAGELNKHLMVDSTLLSNINRSFQQVNGSNATELQELKESPVYEAGDSSLMTSYSSDLSSTSGADKAPGSGGSQNLEPLRRRKKKKKGAVRENEIATGFEIVWLNFTYTVEPNIFEDSRWGRINSLFHKEKRTILKGISGGLKSGQMVALMGPSGAGKTCILECISGVRVAGIGGELKLRGRKKAQLVIVPQYDNFMPQFTVEEIITYGSKMKNLPSTDHKAVTNHVIEQLGLQACRSNNIQKCSGGQRKRVAIAQELVSRPNILILDEPTSGLDSSCCYQTVKVLRDVLDQSVETEQPMAIVTTIHQPSAKVFKMFDLVYVLGKTGYTVFSGPPDELLPTIRDVTGLNCPQYSNPSDYMIELVSYDYGEEPVEKLIEFEKEKASLFVEGYLARSKTGLCHETVSMMRVIKHGNASKNFTYNRESNLNGSTLNVALKSSKSDSHLMVNETSLAKSSDKAVRQRLLRSRNLSYSDYVQYKHNISLPLRKATSSDSSRHPFFWHTCVHLHRSFLQSIRDPILNNMRILIHLGFATLLVLLFGKKSGEARGCPPILGLPTEITDPNNDNMIDLADNVGYLFMCIMMITYVSLMSTVLTFPIDIKTVGKEYKNGWYGTITYFIGKTVADLPFIIIYPVCFCLITWFVTSQAQDHIWRYFSFTGLIIMNALNSQSFGLILGALFVNSVTAATFLGPVIAIPWYLFTGFTKRVHRLAQPYRATSRFLFTRYVFEGLLDTVYGHERCNCSEFLQKYYELRYEEAVRLGKLISAETLSSLDYYDGLDTIAESYNKTTTNASLMQQTNQGSLWFGKAINAATTVFADGEDLNLGALMDTNVKASSLFSFGLDFEPTCPSNYRNYVVQDFRLDERTTENAFISTLGLLAVIRVLTFIVVTWKIRTRQL